MKLVGWFVIVNLVLFFPGHARAASDGNELLQKCGPIEKLFDDPASLSSKEASGVVYCLGYIDSFMETFGFLVQAKIVAGLPYCLPEGELPRKEITGVVVDYLENHSEELAKPAGYHIFMALRQAYPCKDNESTAEQENSEMKTGENTNPAGQ